jgi:hypothetical protein
MEDFSMNSISKKLGLLLVTVCLFGSTQAHALFDLGLNGGLSMSFVSGSESQFTYGGQLNYHFSPSWSLGAKYNRYSADPATVSYLTGSVRYNKLGFFVGADVGVQMVSILGDSTSDTIYGPTVGYYFGTLVKFGVEASYFLGEGVDIDKGLFQPMFGVKFVL